MPPVRLDPFQNIVNVSWRKQVWLFVSVLRSEPSNQYTAGLRIVSPRLGGPIVGRWFWTDYPGFNQNIRFLGDPTGTQFAFALNGSGDPTDLPADPVAYASWVPRYARANDQGGSYPFQCWINLTALADDFPPNPGNDSVAQIELRFCAATPTSQAMTVQSVAGGTARNVATFFGIPSAVTIAGGSTIRSRAYSLPIKAYPPGLSLTTPAYISDPWEPRALSADIEVNCRTGVFATSIVNT